MKNFVIICLLLISNVSFGQSVFLKQAVIKLDSALVTRDTVTLKQLLHKDLTFGHSNGWVETRADVVHDISSGKLIYEKIKSSDAKWTIGNDWASVRNTTEVKYLMDGKNGELKLHVLQVWLKTNKGWQLVARQSTKLL